MRLLAISDLHLRYESNRQALSRLRAHPDDWLIVAGDIGESEELHHWALSALSGRFARVLWTPGNHDLWSRPGKDGEPRGELKYQRLVAICRHYDVVTPEDPYPLWTGPGGPAVVAPVFCLYDYSFGPPGLSRDQMLAWAAAGDVVAADEVLLSPDPHPSREAWCAARCAATETRLGEAARQGPLVLVNHFPLRQDLVRLRRVPRYAPWCGTRRTEPWAERFGVRIGVYGHLHLRGTHVREGVRYEEVSLGYPRDWDGSLGIEPYLREILPGSEGRR